MRGASEGGTPAEDCVKSYKLPDLRQITALRPYRFAVVAVLVFVMATTAAILLNQSSRANGTDTAQRFTIADQGRSEAGAASRGQARAAAVAALPQAAVPKSAEAAADPVSATSTGTTPESPASPEAPEPPAAPAAKQLDYQYQAQINYYYCGPAATRIALSALGRTPSQDTVAGRLGTTTSGTNSAEDTTRALNSLGGTDHYRTTMISGSSATPAEMDRLQADVVRAISNGYAVVTNIVGSATDIDGGWHGYDGGHYVTVVGYRDDGRTVKIADPANVNGQSYWMSTISLAHWIAQRGYSA